jgi:flagellar protein FlaG
VQLGTIYPVGQKTQGQGSQEKNIKNGENGVGEIQPGERVIPKDQLIKAVDKANKSFEPFDRRFEISIHDKFKSVMVKVIDSKTDTVIREIPSEKMLDMVAHMLEVAGILVDERV